MADNDKFPPVLTPSELADADAQGMTPAEYMAAGPDTQDQSLKDQAKAQSESNVAEMQAGNVPIMKNGKLVFVPQDQLTPTEEQEVRTQSNQPPSSSSTTTPTDYASQLMNGLISQFASAESGITPYLNNKVASNDTSYAAGLGQAIGGVAYGQDPAYAAALAGPAQQVAAANAAGAGAITGALQGTGEALNLYMQTAPYQGLLSALQSEAQYKTETGTPTFSIAGTPKWVQQAYAATIGNSAPGTTTPGAAAPTTSSTSPSTDTPDTAGGQ
jgi:hypothetical protein